MQVELRPYQLEALEKVEAAQARGVKKLMGVAATGLGKTIIFAALARRMGCRTLILAHRDELIIQAEAKVRQVWPDAHIGIVKAEQDNYAAQVVIASVQTLAREQRLDRLVGDHLLDPFGLVIVDEAHHTAADTYRGILARLGAGQPDGPLLLGVTATPQRGDRARLDDVFDEIVFNYPMLEGITSGYLCDLQGLRISTKLDLSTVKTSRGDYQAGSAGEAMEASEVPDRIAEAYVEHALGRQALAFTPTVATARLTMEALRERGVAAEMVSADTDPDERRLILKRYAAGDVNVVANCMVLTEGFDDPRTDCIIVGRPTKNRSLYVQMVGRGTRKHPDKLDCLVMDVVGVTDTLSLETLATLFGIDPTERITSVVEAVERVMAQRAAVGAITAREVELFKAMHRAAINWVLARDAPKTYIRPITRKAGDRATVVIQRLPEGDWGAKVVKDGVGREVLVRGVDLEMAQGIAEDYVRNQSQVAAFHRADAGWRLRPPSEKAVAAARKWRGLKVDPSWTAGQLSDAMAAHIAVKTKVV